MDNNEKHRASSPTYELFLRSVFSQKVFGPFIEDGKRDTHSANERDNGTSIKVRERGEGQRPDEFPGRHSPQG